MTQEEKDLFIKDLCTRLPYGVKGKCEIGASYDTSFDTLLQIHEFDAVVYGIKEDLLLVTPLIEYEDEQNFAEEEVADGVHILDFTPYLFPLSSMTEEQLFEVQEILGKNEIKIDDGFLRIVDSDRNVITYLEILAVVEWFYKNHFDINDLIPKDLAIDATGLNIY